MGNTREVNGNAAILARINKGWKPNRYLTNMSMLRLAFSRFARWISLPDFIMNF